MHFIFRIGAKRAKRYLCFIVICKESLQLSHIILNRGSEGLIRLILIIEINHTVDNRSHIQLRQGHKGCDIIFKKRRLMECEKKQIRIDASNTLITYLKGRNIERSILFNYKFHPVQGTGRCGSIGHNDFIAGGPVNVVKRQTSDAVFKRRECGHNRCRNIHIG